LTSDVKGKEQNAETVVACRRNEEGSAHWESGDEGGRCLWRSYILSELRKVGKGGGE